MIFLKYSSLLHSHCLKIVLILLFSLKDYFKLCICVSIGTGVQVPAEPLDPSELELQVVLGHPVWVWEPTWNL